MIAMVGLDHHRASVEARGRLAFSDDGLTTALQTLGGDQRMEVVILSTCNRTEVYLASQRPDEALRQIRAFLAATGAGPALAVGESVALAQALYTSEGLAAAQHLFEVAAGLRSMVIGEPQILGQTRAALATAEQAQVVGEELRLLFTNSFKVGKRVRAETGITRADISVAGLGVRAAREALGGLRGKTALLIGAGRTSRLCGELLQAEGIGQTLIANRSLASAEALAEQVGGHAIAFAQVASALGEADLLISATAAPSIVLEYATLVSARAGR